MNTRINGLAKLIVAAGVALGTVASAPETARATLGGNAASVAANQQARG
jgi:hypothetical protein